MFCYQCEQTAACRGCTGKMGVCGKKEDTAALQDQLTGALIGIARASNGNEHLLNGDITALIIESLFATLTNVNFDNASLKGLLVRAAAAKASMVPDCAVCDNSCGRTDNYDMNDLWNAEEDIRSLKSLILFGIRGVAAYAYHAAILGYHSKTVEDFLYKALFVIGEDMTMEELLPVVLEVGKVNIDWMCLV